MHLKRALLGLGKMFSIFKGVEKIVEEFPGMKIVKVFYDFKSLVLLFHGRRKPLKLFSRETV